MNAAEIIEAIKVLPPLERAKVWDFMQREVAAASLRYASDEDFDRAAKTVMRDHHDLLRRLAQ